MSSLNYTFSSCNAEIIIYGSSTAQHHYDTKIIEDSMKMSCYNAGIDGGYSVLLTYAELLVMAERYTPKIILIEIKPGLFFYNPRTYEKLSILLPYYNSYPVLRPIINLKGGYEKYKLLSRCYPLNSHIINIIRYNSRTHAARKKDINGYVPIFDKTINDAMLKDEKRNDLEYPTDDTLISAMKNIIELCKSKKIKLFFVNSPEYHYINEKPKVESISEKQTIDFLKNENVHFLDYSFDEKFFGRRDLFADKVHLNNEGAKIFSSLIISDLMKYKY